MRPSKLLFSACLIATGTLLSACKDPASPPRPVTAWYGIAANTCGPAGGVGYISIALDTAAYSDCSETHLSEYRVSPTLTSVDSLRAGRIIDWMAEYFCYAVGDGLGKTACGEETLYRLEVESVQASTVNASFRIMEINAAKDTTVRTGLAFLKKCPGPTMCF